MPKKKKKKKIENLKTLKYVFSKNIKSFYIFSKCGQECEKIFKEEESVEILKNSWFNN